MSKAATERAVSPEASAILFDISELKQLTHSSPELKSPAHHHPRDPRKRGYDSTVWFLGKHALAWRSDYAHKQIILERTSRVQKRSGLRGRMTAPLPHEKCCPTVECLQGKGDLWSGGVFQLRQGTFGQR